MKKGPNNREHRLSINQEDLDFFIPPTLPYADNQTVLDRGSLLPQPTTPTRTMNRIVEEDATAVEDRRDSDNAVEWNPQPSRPLSFYSARDANNSSGSLILNKGFTFGGGSSNSSAAVDGMVAASPVQSLNTTVANGSKRNSWNLNNTQAWKYIPQPKLPPTTRTRSPGRNRSPSPERVGHRSQRSSVIAEGGAFNFSSSMLQPPNSSSSRASFRKGHRYKHSSVSMNFFQEPEVKVPLNIAKSLPIPDFSDLQSNLVWPKHHMQMGLLLLQSIACIWVFHLGESRTWTNFTSLSHFIVYDILGSLSIITVDILSQFKVWSTGTITYPFGLNRIDVLLSFAFAVSLCFVGLDLIFHILEEVVVLFVEINNEQQHADLVENIPHSHRSNVEEQDLTLWYVALGAVAFISTTSLFTTFNMHNKTRNYKTKTPLITLCYTLYLVFYPFISCLTEHADYVATVSIALFIMVYGWNVVRWTGTMLLMGFSTTSLAPKNTILLSEAGNAGLDGHLAHGESKKAGDSAASTADSSASIKQGLSQQYEPIVIKSQLFEKIEQLVSFKSKCKFNYSDLLISRVNFELFIVLVKMTMKGGSNEEELELRLAIDKCVRKLFPNVETTVEVERL